jgi:hypothetical protein
VFFSSTLGLATFERSREFDVDDVTRPELHRIADRIRRRFHQQSVLTFDPPERRADPVDAVQVEVRGVSARALRAGFLVDRDARERLIGGSVTVGGRLMLIAALDDVRLAKRFVTEIGADVQTARIQRGRREFVG